MIRKMIIAVVLTLSVLLFIPPTIYADIKLKVAVVNPSTTESQTTPIRYDLPKGLLPTDITDIGQMELKYDFEKGNYYLSKVVKLKPAEKLVLEIRIRDVWMIPQKEIDFLKNHTKALTASLAKTKHSKTGNALAKKIIDRLDDISKKQSDQNLTMAEHINLYYENVTVLGEVKEDIGMLENLVIDVGGIVEERVKVPSTLALPVKTDETGQAARVELVVKASNPSKTTKQPVDIRFMLPEEVSPRYITDRGDLELGYDFSKQAFYVYKNKVMLNPSETKNFVIKIMDIWQIPPVEIDALRAHTDNLMLLLSGTEYAAQAKTIADRIAQELKEIGAAQDLKVSADEHIGYFRKNRKLLAEAKNSVSQLEKLAVQSGASPGVTIKEAEVQKGGGPKERRPRGYEGIDYIVKSIFRGKAPSPATTWKIIFSIVGFIGILSALFFFLWYTQIRRSQDKTEKTEQIEPKEKE